MVRTIRLEDSFSNSFPLQTLPTIMVIIRSTVPITRSITRKKVKTSRAIITTQRRRNITTRTKVEAIRESTTSTTKDTRTSRAMRRSSRITRIMRGKERRIIILSMMRKAQSIKCLSRDVCTSKLNSTKSSTVQK